MPIFRFKQNSPSNYSCKTKKGSEVIIYRRNGKYDWFIKPKNDTYEAAPKATSQVKEVMTEFNDLGWDTKEEAASHLVSCCSNVFKQSFDYLFKGEERKYEV